MNCRRPREELEVTEVQGGNMKLPYIRKATWEKEYHPGAKWIVVERKYGMYFGCKTLYNAICIWLVSLKTFIKDTFKFRKKK